MRTVHLSLPGDGCDECSRVVLRSVHTHDGGRVLIELLVVVMSVGFLQQVGQEALGDRDR